MPTYDFECEGCGYEFEQLTDVGATPACPACGSEQTRRLWSPGFRTLKWGVRGRAARESDSHRAEREAAHQDRLAEIKKKRRRGEQP